MRTKEFPEASCCMLSGDFVNAVSVDGYACRGGDDRTLAFLRDHQLHTLYAVSVTQYVRLERADNAGVAHNMILHSGVFT